MLYIPPFRLFMIWLTVAVGLLLALPNGFYTKVEAYNDAEAAGAEATGWPDFLPSGLVNLGLDLRGGAHLLAEVQLSDVHEAMIEATWPEVRNALAAERDVVGFVERDEGAAPDVLRVRISEPAGADRAVEIVRGLARQNVSVLGTPTTDIQVSANGPVLTITLTEDERALAALDYSPEFKDLDDFAAWYAANPDATLIAGTGAFGLACIAAAGFVATLALQRVASGT